MSNNHEKKIAVLHIESLPEWKACLEIELQLCEDFYKSLRSLDHRSPSLKEEFSYLKGKIDAIDELWNKRKIFKKLETKKGGQEDADAQE